MKFNYNKATPKNIRTKVSIELLGQRNPSKDKLRLALLKILNRGKNGFEINGPLSKLIYLYWYGNMFSKAVPIEVVLDSKKFYKTTQWRELRERVFRMYGYKCMKCGSTKDPVVDHIKPRSKYPHLALDINNMQVLCNNCNYVKLDKNCNDYRHNHIECIKKC